MCIEKYELDNFDPFNGSDWIYPNNWTSISYNISTLQEIIEEVDGKTIILLSLPGVKKDDLELIVEKDILKIIYEGTTDFIQPFEREYTIEGYKGKEAKISLVDGVLEIVMEKKDSYKPKKLKF